MEPPVRAAAVARFYATCALCWPGDRPFWLALAREEMEHHKTCKRIEALVRAKPAYVVVGRAFRPQAVELVRQGVERQTHLAMARKLPLRGALVAAQQIENSIIENRYWEILRSLDDEFDGIVAAAGPETHVHRRRLETRLAALDAEEAGPAPRPASRRRGTFERRRRRVVSVITSALSRPRSPLDQSS